MGKIGQIFKNRNIGDKLIALFGLTAVYVVFFCVYIISSYSNLKDSLNRFSDQQSFGIFRLYELSEELNSLVVRNHAIIESGQDVLAVQRHHNKFNQFFEKKVKDYENTLTTAQEIALIDRFKNEFVVYQNVNRDIIRLLINGRNETACELLSVKETGAFDEMRKTLGLMYEEHKNNLTQTDRKLTNAISSLYHSLIVWTIPLVLLIIFAGVYVIRFIKSNFKALTAQMMSLSKGIIPETELFQGKSEIGLLGKYINKTSQVIKSLTDFSNQIAEGNYSYDSKEIDAIDGTIAGALVNLSNSLRQNQESQNKRRVEDEQRNWTTQGLAKFGDILQHNNDKIEVLTDEVIKNLVHYVAAAQGGLFILNEDNPDDMYLDLVSAFAYDRKKFLTRKITIGDGLVGMCALEKNLIYITQIPEDYLEIESGLGDSKPKCLLIVPLKSAEGKILGVIELASFNLMKEHEISFVEKLGDNIASTLSTLRINARTADLLKDSQKKADELANRENELKKSIEESTVAREEAQKRESEMAGILSAVDETLLKAEIDPEGKFISANQKFLLALGYRKEELIGRNIKTIMPDEYLENFDMIWQNICSGQAYQTNINQKNKFGENIWLLTQYTPIFDAQNAVVRVLYMANDITEQKQVEERNRKLLADANEKAEVLMATQEKMVKNEIEMSGIIMAIDETMMKAEYTVEGNMISANSKHITTMGYDYEKTKGKNIITFIPDNEVLEFKALWQKVCEGNLYQMTVKRQSKMTGRDIWLINQYTPVKDKDGKVFKILYTAFDITKHKETELIASAQVDKLHEQNEALRSQLEVYREKENTLKTQLNEFQKIESLDMKAVDKDKSMRYQQWLQSLTDNQNK